MTPTAEQALLRLHLANLARSGTRPLYEVLVERARHAGLAGATVLAGAYGYTGRGRIVGEPTLAPQAAHPVVVEIVDEEARLLSYLEDARALLEGGEVLVTLERARVVRGNGGEGRPTP